jgi:hypothetical protein
LILIFGRHIPFCRTVRSAVAVLMAAALLSLVTPCCLAAYGSAMDSSASGHACCHQHRCSGMPCAPHKKMQECEHNLLERCTTAFTADLASNPLAASVPELAPMRGCEKLLHSEMLADSSGLYLRIHVLLI